MSRKRHNPKDETADRAIALVSTADVDDMQRRERIRQRETELRNERIRRAREAAGPDGGDAA